MRAWLIEGVRRFLRWIDPPPLPPAPDVLKDAARQLMAVQDGYADRRGDHKRRIVLNTLREQFPESRVRDLAYAIESVMQEYP